MICFNLGKYQGTCNPVSGGVNRAWIFDPMDFIFTTSVGTGYPHIINYSALALRNGTGATATATFDGAGAINAITIGVGGTGYPFAPTVVITDPTGTGATATAKVVGGVVVSITITAGGAGYTAPVISFINTGATLAGGGQLFPLNFDDGSGQYTWDNPEVEAGAGSAKFEHLLVSTLKDISGDLNQFLVDTIRQGSCCGIGVVFQLNSGRIFIMGERFSSTEGELLKFPVHAFTSGDSGKAYEDFNGATLNLKGNYSRLLREYTGGVNSLEAFVEV